jgi:RimJ/RimL family protein N-acetyltransferase
VSLNTQADNIASHRLYDRFGFTLLEEKAFVYSMTL